MFSKFFLSSLLLASTASAAALSPREEPLYPHRMQLRIWAPFSKWQDGYLVPSLNDPNPATNPHPTIAVGQVGDHSADHFHIDSHGRLTMTMWKMQGFGTSKDLLYAAVSQDRADGDYTQPMVFVPDNADSSKWEIKGGFNDNNVKYLTVDGRDEFYVCEGVAVKGGVNDRVYNSIHFALGKSGRAGKECSKVKLSVLHT